MDTDRSNRDGDVVTARIMEMMKESGAHRRGISN